MHCCNFAQVHLYLKLLHILLARKQLHFCSCSCIFTASAAIFFQHSCVSMICSRNCWKSTHLNATAGAFLLEVVTALFCSCSSIFTDSAAILPLLYVYCTASVQICAMGILLKFVQRKSDWLNCQQNLYCWCQTRQINKYIGNSSFMVYFWNLNISKYSNIITHRGLLEICSFLIHCPLHCKGSTIIICWFFFPKVY